MIIFDTETTNLAKAIDAPLDKQPKIIDYYGLKVDDDTLEIQDEYETLIHPRESITDEITKITGIDDAIVKGAPAFPEVYQPLAEFHLGQISMVGHNISFDVDMLTFELRRIGKLRNFPWPMKHICSVEETEHLEGRRLKLIDLHKHLFGEGFDGAHRARPDVEATHRCLVELRKRGEF